MAVETEVKNEGKYKYGVTDIDSMIVKNIFTELTRCPRLFSNQTSLINEKVNIIIDIMVIMKIGMAFMDILALALQLFTAITPRTMLMKRITQMMVKTTATNVDVDYDGDDDDDDKNEEGEKEEDAFKYFGEISIGNADDRAQ